MALFVSVERVHARKLAAVRRRITIGAIAAAWRPALDRVWEFVRSEPGLRTDGHNVFLYHHAADMNAPMDVDFGVEVTRGFDAAGDVYPTETPAGEVAAAVHVGSYDHMKETHGAIHAWAKAHGRQFAGQSWEIYGDWSDDPSRLETTIQYLLK